MIRSLRPLAAIALALVLVLTAQSMAAARGAPAVAGAITLCTGAGPVTLLTDAEGQPLAPSHICPDCTLTLDAGPAGPMLALSHVAVRIAPLLPRDTSVRLDAVMQPFSARDPPAVV